MLNTELILKAREFKRNNPSVDNCIEQITGKGRFKRLNELANDPLCCVTSFTNTNPMRIRYYA